MPEQDSVIAALDSNPDILVVDMRKEKPNKVMSSFSVITFVKVAPKQPLSEPKKLEEFVMGLIPKVILSREGISYGSLGLNSNCVYINEGEGRTIITAYPSEQVARDEIEGRKLYQITS